MRSKRPCSSDDEWDVDSEVDAILEVDTGYAALEDEDGAYRLPFVGELASLEIELSEGSKRWS